MDFFEDYKSTIYSYLLMFLVDYLFRFLYPPPTSELATTLKNHYLPTYYLNYYNLVELQALGRALVNATTSGQQIWVEKVLGFSLFTRQVLPISGVYYVEVLTVHVYGFFSGLFYCWFIEVFGAVACFVWANLMAHRDWHHEEHGWTHLLRAMADVDASVISRRTRSLSYPTTLTTRTQTSCMVLLIALRVTSRTSNWVANYSFVEMGVPFSEYLLSAALGALPHLFYSAIVGVYLQEHNEPIEISGRLDLIHRLACFLVQGLLFIIMARYFLINSLERIIIRSSRESREVLSNND